MPSMAGHLASAKRPVGGVVFTDLITQLLYMPTISASASYSRWPRIASAGLAQPIARSGRRYLLQVPEGNRDLRAPVSSTALLSGMQMTSELKLLADRLSPDRSLRLVATPLRWCMLCLPARESVDETGQPVNNIERIFGCRSPAHSFPFAAAVAVYLRDRSPASPSRPLGLCQTREQFLVPDLSPKSVCLALAYVYGRIGGLEQGDAVEADCGAGPSRASAMRIAGPVESRHNPVDSLFLSVLRWC